jgi:hypothetical protein
MRKRWLWGALCALLLPAAPVRAADHADGPATTAAPAADITDVFAWMSSDKSKLYMVLDVFPAATSSSRFDPAVLYVLHTKSKASILAAGGSTLDVICQFDSAQKISCWAGDSYVSGATAGIADAGLTSADGHLTVWAGLRDDPFFFNLDGFKTMVGAVKGAKAGLTFDASGCPDNIDAGTSAALVSALAHDPSGNAPQDHFKGLNVLAIVVALDASLVTRGGSTVGVWASTNKVAP